MKIQPIAVSGSPHRASASRLVPEIPRSPGSRTARVRRRRSASDPSAPTSTSRRGVVREGANRAGATRVHHGGAVGPPEVVERGADAEKRTEAVHPPQVVRILPVSPRPTGRDAGRRRYLPVSSTTRIGGPPRPPPPSTDRVTSRPGESRPRRRHRMLRRWRPIRRSAGRTRRRGIRRPAAARRWPRPAHELRR